MDAGSILGGRKLEIREQQVRLVNETSLKQSSYLRRASKTTARARSRGRVGLAALESRAFFLKD